MIKLPEISKAVKEKFYNDNKKRFEQLLLSSQKKCEFHEITRYFFDSNNLNQKKVKNVLIGDINCLIDAIKQIGPQPGDSNASPQKEFKRLYDKFINRIMGKELCDLMNVKVCPYCNRSYIHTLSNHGVRPQYDHFFDKIRYPYLAISLYNLIPSCSICNQAKSNFDTYSDQSYSFLYPYIDEYGYDVFFKTNFKSDISFYLGGNANFELTIENDAKDSNLRNRVDNTKNQLHIEELYEKHKDYVLDIIRASQIYNKEYIYDLFKRFPNLFASIDEVKRMTFMNYLDKEHWGDRVLAKLTHDIVREYQ